MSRILISTTNNLPGGKDYTYCGVVSSHVVVGTGLFSELFAGFTDIFGGKSNAFKRQLDDLYSEALDELSSKARHLRANAIVGLKVDIDEISGKGMSMFMITAIGTAVRSDLDNSIDKKSALNVITKEELNNHINIQNIIERLDNNKSISSEDWELIYKSTEAVFISPLTRRLFYIFHHADRFNPNYINEFNDRYIQFVENSENGRIVDAIYEEYENESDNIYGDKVIIQNNLFDPKHILSLIQKGMVKKALRILSAERPSYSYDDVAGMEDVLNALNILPDVGRIEEITPGLLSKETKAFVCQHGHKTKGDVEYCSSCHENIKGITDDEMESIKLFKERVDLLHELFKKSHTD